MLGKAQGQTLQKTDCWVQSRVAVALTLAELGVLQHAGVSEDARYRQEEGRWPHEPTWVFSLLEESMHVNSSVSADMHTVSLLKQAV